MTTKNDSTPLMPADATDKGVGTGDLLGDLVRTFPGGIDAIGMEIRERGLVLTLRRRGNFVYACNPPRHCPDEVWRETYELRGGKICKTKHETGTHMPAREIPETFVFD